MKLYTISAITGFLTIPARGTKAPKKVPLLEGKISDLETCRAFRVGHLALGHHVSKLRRWSGGGGTHGKSLSGFRIDDRKERHRKLRPFNLGLAPRKKAK